MQDNTRRNLKVAGRTLEIFQLPALPHLPFSLKVLLENLLRYEDGMTVTRADIEALQAWDPTAKPAKEIAFRPARILMQDFTGVPALVDLASMRDAVKCVGKDPKRINPLIPADLVIDHSLQVDVAGCKEALEQNVRLEFQRNRERYQFLKWGQKAFANFRVVPPGTGIIHQVNLEYLANVVCSSPRDGAIQAYPDTVAGTDSHTTMINGLGVLGWGVGGIEAEAAMLGQPMTMLIPQVVGVKLQGELPEDATATDLVLTLTEMLRAHNVVDKFVEFCGPGLSHLSLADRATIANMAPEYGATVGFFPVDEETLRFLRLTGREESLVALVEAYTKEQGLFRRDKSPQPAFSEMLELDLSKVQPSLAGPRRPQDRMALKDAKENFRSTLASFSENKKEDISKTVVEIGDTIPPEIRGHDPNFKIEIGSCPRISGHVPNFQELEVRHGSVVIAAITSCANTSNPALMLGAGLLAKKAVERGLHIKPWVKTSLTPGSKAVTDYLQKAGLLEFLEKLHFNLAGYGCATCIGNSGPLSAKIQEAIRKNGLMVAAVLCGNRNFEGRIHPLTRANYLASPALVVAYALAGTMDMDLTKEPLGRDKSGKDVYLKDIWPSKKEIGKAIKSVTAGVFKAQYADVFSGGDFWKELNAPTTETYGWDAKSTYVKNPPYFDELSSQTGPLQDIRDARVLLMLGDSVTTDHISPAGSIAPESPAGRYLSSLGVRHEDFNSYGARRGNHEVMMRGTFANSRLKNLLVPGSEGGWTRHFPHGQVMSVYDAAMRYQAQEVPLVVLAGREYGTGSSRDWAAKGPRLLGVYAVIAESFERIHRSNLIGMGILPLEFLKGENCQSLGLTGRETFDITGIAGGLKPGGKLKVTAKDGGSAREFEVLVRIDTAQELDYYRHGGVLPYVLRRLFP